eukprot:CAMPEP_0177636202 /NCGR_PEP_ID=MMETSP0447-20121125/4309_1 /TAXON_ID=0 /ORGANISM="Stygamoeba regulata, Strain BSH-02190019" /LENGTH=46 /DNA_ID= /DNA_START= /DNA_END= /DNA_ORIENTATION=
MDEGVTPSSCPAASVDEIDNRCPVVVGGELEVGDMSTMSSGLEARW